MPGRCLVDLDPLIDLKRYNSVSRSQINHSPVKILDMMLGPPPKCSPRRKRLKHKPTRYSPQVNKKKAKAMLEKRPEPSGVCPKCKIFVEGSPDEDGVVCMTCNAYWHFNCAEVTHEILEMEWAGIEYLCAQHRNTSEVDGLIPTNLYSGEKKRKMKCDIVTSDIKIHNYSLNINKKLKEKLQNLDTKIAVELKDNGGQYSISFNSTSYQLIVVNMIEFGSPIGTVEVPRNDVDKSGNHVQDRYIITIGPEFKLSITCYHTTSSILLQLMGMRTSEKLCKLEQFVTKDFLNHVQNLEKSSKYVQSRNILKAEIEKEIVERAQLPINNNDESKIHSRTYDGPQHLVASSVAIDINTSGSPLTGCKNNCGEIMKIVDTKDKQDVTLLIVEESGVGVSDSMTTDDEIIAAEGNCLKGSESNAVVLIPKGTRKTNTKKVMESFSILRKMEYNESERNNFLWDMIMKLKVKGDELKSRELLTYYPSANAKLNDLTLQLVE